MPRILADSWRRMLIGGVLAIIAMTGCTKSAKAKVEASVVKKYLGLLSEVKWDEDDRRDFLEILTLRGLNQTLHEFGAGSFDEFQKLPLDQRDRYGKVKLLDDYTKEIGIPPTILVDGMPAKTHALYVIFRQQKGEKQAFASQITTVDGKIHDIQVRKAEAKTKATFWSVALGIYISFWLLGFFFGRQKKTLAHYILLMFFVSILGGRWATGGGSFKSIFVKVYFNPAGESFASHAIPFESPYPGPAVGTFRDGVRAQAEKYLDFVAVKSNASAQDALLARNYWERGRELGLKQDLTGLNQAITLFQKSLAYQFQAQVFLDLAYSMSSLGRLGVNPDINYLRVECLLDAFQKRQGKSVTPFIARGEASVKAINLASLGKNGDAEKLLKSAFVNQELAEVSKMDLPDGIIEKTLEAKFLLESGWEAKRKIAEDLVRKSPNNAKYYNYKGLAAYNLKDAKAAQLSFERAIALSPDFGDAVANLAAVRRNMIPEAGLAPNSKIVWRSEPKGYPLAEALAYVDLATTSALAPEIRTSFSSHGE